MDWLDCFSSQMLNRQNLKESGFFFFVKGFILCVATYFTVMHYRHRSFAFFLQHLVLKGDCVACGLFHVAICWFSSLLCLVLDTYSTFLIACTHPMCCICVNPAASVVVVCWNPNNPSCLSGCHGFPVSLVLPLDLVLRYLPCLELLLLNRLITKVTKVYCSTFNIATLL